MFNRAILHLDLDAFFVSVECLRDSSLKGKPLIIGGGKRGVVSSCSYEARRYGVHSAMPTKMALRLCPDAIVIRGDMEAYSKHSKLVTEVIADDAPLFEKASIDEFYLDLTGMDKYVGCWKWSTELRQRIAKETGLPTSFGLAINKLVAKVGTGEAKPSGTLMIEAGREKGFLSPLPTRAIPSIGKSTYKKLSFMGVRTVGKLAGIPPLLLQREFGKHGLSLWRKANGEDDRPVVPYHERKSISKERTFKEDTIDVRYLKSRITDLVTKLAFELRESQKLTSCVTIKIRYADFNTYTHQSKIPYTANDRLLLDKALELFDKLYGRRQFVRLIGVRFSGLVHGNYQMQLFEDTAEETQLMQQMDQIRRRFGKGVLNRASSLQ